MNRFKRFLAICLSAAFLAISASGSLVQVQADSSALARSYNSDVSYVAYTMPAEDQSQTNYCWAYMANAVLESYLMKNAGVPQINLSETDMVWQLSNGIYGYSNLYTGGSYHQALAYWTRGSQYGPRTEDTGLTGHYVSETAELGSYQRDSEASKLNYIQNIKNLVVRYGAVGVSVHFTAEARTMTTRDGAYYYPQEASPGVNHGVTVVGWDDDFAPQWFYNSTTVPHQPSNKGAFLVKNSWGRYDASSINGNTGYYWISYDNYFQDAFAVTQVTDRLNLYDYLYETDYRGLYGYAAGSSFTQTYRLNPGTQWLSGFATYVREGASYRFYLNNQELTQFSGTMAHSGYHTFRLANPVQVYGTLELRAEVTSTEDAVPIACSKYSYEPDGSNVCLKVFTRTYPEIPSQGPSNNQTIYPGITQPTITGVTLTPQDCKVMQGASQVFTARVLGTGNPSQRISWQISGSSSAYTRITDNGILYVGADEPSSVLYIYANAYDNSAQGASARVEVTRAGTSNNASQNNTGTNINGSPSGNNSTSAGSSASGNNGTSAGNSSAGSSTSTGSNASTGQTGDSNINGSEAGDKKDDDVRVVKVGKGVYAFWGDGSAWYTKSASTSYTSISIPETVKVGGHVYDVTILDDGCLKNHKKAKTVMVGENVAQIGEEAFYGCKQLKKIKIKSEQIEYIGEDAFRGISGEAVIYVPRSCLTEYRAMVRESGNTEVRVKAW